MPTGDSWYDFWTGELLKRWPQVHRATPIEIMALYVSAGSIIPWEQEVKYVTKKECDKLEPRICLDVDADLILYIG